MVKNIHRCSIKNKNFVIRMDLDHYDEFGNYIGPELEDSDSEESVAEETSEMPLVPTGVVEEGTEEIEEDESMQGNYYSRDHIL